MCTMLLWGQQMCGCIASCGICYSHIWKALHLSYFAFRMTLLTLLLSCPLRLLSPHLTPVILLKLVFILDDLFLLNPFFTEAIS